MAYCCQTERTYRSLPCFYSFRAKLKAHFKRDMLNGIGINCLSSQSQHCSSTYSVGPETLLWLSNKHKIYAQFILQDSPFKAPVHSEARLQSNFTGRFQYDILILARSGMHFNLFPAADTTSSQLTTVSNIGLLIILVNVPHFGQCFSGLVVQATLWMISRVCSRTALYQQVTELGALLLWWQE